MLLPLQSLLRQNTKSEIDDFHVDVEVIENVDPFNDVLLTVWQPSGLQRFFMAPRRLRMRRLWRWAPFCQQWPASVGLIDFIYRNYSDQVSPAHGLQDSTAGSP